MLRRFGVDIPFDTKSPNSGNMNKTVQKNGILEKNKIGQNVARCKVNSEKATVKIYILPESRKK